MEKLIPIITKYKSLDLQNVIDHDRFNQYAIVHHSSGIEGSTLTETETRLLLEEGTTPKGKPLAHSLMVKDHFDALQFILNAANEQRKVDIEFIQTINSKVMKSTGSVYQTLFGEIDASKGAFRKGNVSAGGSYFVNFDKVVDYTERLVVRLNEQMKIANTIPEQLRLSFVAHFDLVSIHPFYDGNGRTSRLLMNFIQAYFKLPLAIVYQEDKKDYYDALVASRKAENTIAFEAFMEDQYRKFLTLEMEQFEKDMSKDLPQNKKQWPGSGFSIFFG
ncbi:MAG: Fic family protein [Chitinophaga sp.]|jgi:Fic family protein|nr:Fic family protein [Chitinophaga sp.]PJE47134.1 MAG: Fic family protein [Sediminibacterium sp.] [Sediminibacterium sp. FEMGT703S]